MSDHLRLLLISLAVAGCAMDGEPELDTDSVESASTVTQWKARGWVPNQKSEYQVGLAYFNGRLQMVHNGHSDPHELWWTSFDGNSWTANVKLPHRATGGPALQVRNGRLDMVYRDASQNRLLIASYDGFTFGAPRAAGSPLDGQVLKSEPATGLTSFGKDLLVAYCTNTSVRIDRYDGTRWELAHSIPAPDYSTCEHVELAGVIGGGEMNLYYATENEMISWRDYPIYEVNGDGFSWGTPRALPNKKTKQPISIVTCRGKTHMTHGGLSDASEVWWSERVRNPNGSYDWGPDERVPNQHSWGGAAVGCMGGIEDPQRTFMIHNNTDGRLYQLEFFGS